MIAHFGHRSGWLSTEQSRRLLLATVDRLFRSEAGEKAFRGVYAAVRNRFESAGRVELFDQKAGDGTFWLALIAALSGLR